MKAQGTVKKVEQTFRQNPVITIEVACDPADAEKYIDANCDIEIKRHRERRSTNANAMLWSCITQLADAIHIDDWTMYKTEVMRYGVSTLVRIKEEAIPDLRKAFRVVRVIEHRSDGTATVACYYGSSAYNSKEFSRMIDGVISDMHELHLEAPGDEEIEALIKSMEEEEHEGTH